MIAYRILLGSPKGRIPVGRPRHIGRIILKWTLEKFDGVIWTGLIWPNIGTSRGLL
jgi:hypothetical protein